MLYCMLFFFFFKQKTAYEMRISDWSSDVCSSDLWRWAGTRQRKFRACPALCSTFPHARATAMQRCGPCQGERPCLRPAPCLAAARARGKALQSTGHADRKSVAEGKRVSVRVDLGGRRTIKKKINKPDIN